MTRAIYECDDSFNISSYPILFELRMRMAMSALMCRNAINVGFPYGSYLMILSTSIDQSKLHTSICLCCACLSSCSLKMGNNAVDITCFLIVSSYSLNLLPIDDKQCHVYQKFFVHRYRDQQQRKQNETMMIDTKENGRLSIDLFLFADTSGSFVYHAPIGYGCG